jgi:hypothetical protein
MPPTVTTDMDLFLQCAFADFRSIVELGGDFRSIVDLEGQEQRKRTFRSKKQFVTDVYEEHGGESHMMEALLYMDGDDDMFLMGEGGQEVFVCDDAFEPMDFHNLHGGGLQRTLYNESGQEYAKVWLKFRSTHNITRRLAHEAWMIDNNGEHWKESDGTINPHEYFDEAWTYAFGFKFLTV